MRLAKALKDKLMDVRLRDKLLAEGKITKAQLNDYLKELGDDQSNGQYIEEKEAATAAE